MALGLVREFFYEWDPTTYELRQRVNAGGEILRTVHDVTSEAQASRLVDEYLQARDEAETGLHQAALNALQVNEDQMKQNLALWQGAQDFIADSAIQDYSAAGKTQIQVLGDLLAGLKSLDQKTKQLANAVQVLLVHDQTTKTQLNELIKLVVGKPDVSIPQPGTAAFVQQTSLSSNGFQTQRAAVYFLQPSQAGSGA